jgi:hypothetical protein
MTAIQIPDPLPPWITPDRAVIEFFLDQDLEEFGDDSHRRPRAHHPGPTLMRRGHCLGPQLPNSTHRCSDGA